MDEQYNKCHLSWPKNHVGWNCRVLSSWEVVMEIKNWDLNFFGRFFRDFDLWNETFGQICSQTCYLCGAKLYGN